MSSAVAAGPAVDPGTLNPAPPAGATCSQDGGWIICRTALHLSDVDAPVFDLPCGTLYETMVDDRRGIRWYDSDTRTIVKRFVSQDAEGSWSLSPDGGGPTVRVSIHANWRNPAIADGDIDSAPLVYHGEQTVSAPGRGVIAHTAGLDEPDGTHHGTLRFLDDPAVAAALCRALGA